ncbi:hypothetical protein B0T21DRAFT_415401 [Apiosordaria backusii]|uniref:Uncharacterized protein n=1 Tax=Apiosordaria backusii TaxID=314023 RepID=A0AA40DV43_9PEZI|nr:hypothetical protein B0T21DRAFT_415401 [Apiosordaria backusii]
MAIKPPRTRSSSTTSSYSVDTIIHSRTRSSSTASSSSTDTVIHHHLPTSPSPTEASWQATLPTLPSYRTKPVSSNDSCHNKSESNPNNNQQPTIPISRRLPTPAEQQDSSPIITHITTFPLKFLTTPTPILTSALYSIFPPSHFYCWGISLPSQPPHDQIPAIYRHPIPNFPLWHPPRGFGLPESFRPEWELNLDPGNRAENGRYGNGRCMGIGEGELGRWRKEQWGWLQWERLRDWVVVVVGRDRLGDLCPGLIPTSEREGVEGYFREQNQVGMRRLGEVVHCEVDFEGARGVVLEVIGSNTSIGLEHPSRVERGRIAEGLAGLEREILGLIVEKGWGGDVIGGWEELQGFALWGWVDSVG